MPGYRAKKRLGQNFLKTQTVVDRVVSQIDASPDDSIIEIGPGRGALTLPLAESGATVHAVEYDRDLLGYLESLLSRFKNVHLHHQDFLEFEPDTAGVKRFKLIGNLPYNITTPTIDWCLGYRDRIEVAVLMVQKELGARISGKPGSRNWSPLALFTQLVFEVEPCFDVSPQHFRPVPNVYSSVLRLTPRPAELGKYTPELDRVVRSSFRHRRKQLVNNLVPDLVPDAAAAREILAELDLDLKIRAEMLTLDQFLKLTSHLARRKLV
jgi:16S rRNA (adenine1518-N6/adenine1519-N6)-dimethyltransferase